MTDIEREVTDNGKALRKMLTIALNNQQTITWGRICDALRNRMIDESVYAQELESNLQRMIIAKRQQATTLDTKGI